MKPHSVYGPRLTFLLLAMALHTAASAQATRTMSYQGLLTTPSGDPVPDGSRMVTFAIYDAPVNGIKKWSETKIVSTAGGYFNTELGSDTTITGFLFNRDLWLGVRIAGDPEIMPRAKLNSVPSAFGLVFPFVAEEDEATAAFEITNAGLGSAIVGNSPSGVAGVMGTASIGDGVRGLAGSGVGVFGRAFDPGGEGGYFWGYEGGGIVEPDVRLQGKGLISSSGTLSLESTSDSVAILSPFEARKTTRLLDSLIVETDNLPAYPQLGLNDDIIVKANDAVLGLYSDPAGTFGSAIVLGELTSSAIRSRWAITRRTSSAASILEFRYGPNLSYASNPPQMAIDSTGGLTAFGPAVADTFRFRFPKMSYTSVSAAAFSPAIVSATTAYASTYDGANINAGSSIHMDAPVSLPQGANLREFTCRVYDNVGANLRCYLYMVNWGASGPEPAVALYSATSSGTPGYASYTDDTINFVGEFTVDNQDMTFAVAVYILGDDWQNVSTDLSIRQVVIGYEMPGPG